jgi:hypothetical protein
MQLQRSYIVFPHSTPIIDFGQPLGVGPWRVFGAFRDCSEKITPAAVAAAALSAIVQKKSRLPPSLPRLSAGIIGRRRSLPIPGLWTTVILALASRAIIGLRLSAADDAATLWQKNINAINRLPLRIIYQR